VNPEFDTSGRLRADMARPGAAREIATTSVALTQRDLRRAVTTAYYRALLTRRIVRIIDDALTESRNFQNRARLLFQGGEAAQADVVKASEQVAFLQQGRPEDGMGENDWDGWKNPTSTLGARIELAGDAPVTR
jgi:outer membrane protein TolC